MGINLDSKTELDYLMLKLGEIFFVLIEGMVVEYSVKPQGGEEKPLEKHGSS